MKKVLMFVVAALFALASAFSGVVALGDMGKDAVEGVPCRESCAFVEAVEEHECEFAHEHDDECGYVEAVDEIACDCDHSSCGYVAAVEVVDCDFVCDHSSCAYDAGVVCDIQDCIHDDCDYVAETPCDAVCDHSACAKVDAEPEVPCGCAHTDCAFVAAIDEFPCAVEVAHEHDESCGYIEAVEAVGHDEVVICETEGCTHSCEVLDCDHSECGYDEACVYDPGCPFVAAEDSDKLIDKLSFWLIKGDIAVKAFGIASAAFAFGAGIFFMWGLLGKKSPKTSKGVKQPVKVIPGAAPVPQTKRGNRVTTPTAPENQSSKPPRPKVKF